MKTIVPGARDLISPHGQFTITLTDERGRLKMRQVVENLVMNQLQEAISTQMRGQQNVSTGIGFDATGAQVLGVDTDNAKAAVGQAYPRVYCDHRQMLRSLFLSFNTAAPVANEWHPLGLIGGANSNAVYAGTNARRGNWNLPLSQRRPDGVRYVWDFGLDRCNGQLIASAGMGGVGFPAGEASNFCCAWHTYNQGILNSTTGYPIGNIVTNSAAPISASKYWSYGPSGLSLIDLALSTVWSQNTNAVLALAGPTLATLGGANALNGGLAIIGTDMWVMDTLRLRRSIIPVDATYTALTTYSPVVGFTDPACLGLCTDGTNLYALGATKVFIINPATGAVTSSWTHGVTFATGAVTGVGYQSIYYEPIHDCVWITGIRDVYLGNGASAEAAYSELAGPGATSAANATPFTKSGTYMGLGTRPFFEGSGNSFPSFFYTMDGGRWLITVGSSQGSQLANYITHGGNVGTRALLTSPFTKTASEAMRVQYDIAFSVPP